jgi:predicted TIM-barrel fold metal-dependent hydrolase
MDKLIVVSGDSHATPPPEVWPQYVEAKYHELLPGVNEDNERYVQLLGIFANFPPEILDVMDTDGAWASGGYVGAWDCDRRLAEMDREGVAAEMVYAGDPRAITPLSPQFRPYPQDVVAAGNRAYHRWAADAFGSARDRILCVGDPGSGVDMDAMLAELDWIAEHGFVGTYVPTMTARPDFPPLYDQFFEPFWSRVEDTGLTLVIHAGFGTEQCEFLGKIEDLKRNMEAEGRDDLLSEIINNAEGFFSKDLRPRRAMWQMMLGGVFDRHPGLKLVMTEVRGDWLPATLAHLDRAYEQARAELPARRRPSEYWHEHGLMSLSFIHKSEVAMRHQMGIETIFFGRDYPHAEGTWPNTRDWLSDAFAGVPDDELRLLLGENAIRVLGLDRARLAAVAERIGPTVADVTGRTPDLDARLLANWDARGGYLKPPEEIDPEAIDNLLRRDIALATARS